MAEHGLEEFEYARDDFRIRLKKASHNSVPVLRSAIVPEIRDRLAFGACGDGSSSSAAAAAGGGGAARETAPAEQGAPKSCTSSSRRSSAHFMRAKSGGRPSCGGRQVEAGQMVCIIEAMKLMNEIEADIGGRSGANPGRKRPAGGIRRAAVWLRPHGKK